MEYNKYDDLVTQESLVNKKTIEEFPEIGWFKQFYEDLQKIIILIPDVRREDELRENPAIFYLNKITTLQLVYNSTSILHLISRGYYGQSMILLRSMQELFQHMLFFNFHLPNDIKQWNEGRIKSTRIQSYMSTSKHIPKKWKGISNDHFKLYEMLSKFVHPSRIGWSGVVKIDDVSDDHFIKLLPKYESNSFRNVFFALMSFIANVLLLLLEIYEKEVKGSGIFDIITEKIRQFEQEYMWPTYHIMQLDTKLNVIGQ